MELTHLEILEKYWKCNKIVAETGKTVQEVWDNLTVQENENDGENTRKTIS